MNVSSGRGHILVMRSAALLMTCALAMACNAPRLESDAATSDAAPTDAVATDSADVDARIDGSVDASPDASTDACATTSTFGVGPTTSTNVQVARSGNVLYAVYSSSPGPPGLWFSATTIDGQVITAPVQVPGTIDVPQSIAVNGSRVLVLGNDHIQAVDLDGAVAAPAMVAPSGGMLVPGPGTGFRILYSVPCWPSPCNPNIDMQTLDRDGVSIATSMMCAAGYPMSVATAPDGSAVFGATRRQSVGPCSSCDVSGVGILPSTDGCQYAGDVEPTPEAPTSRPSVANDGSTTYVSWDASVFGTNQLWLKLARYPSMTPLAQIARSEGIIAASSGGHGAVLSRVWYGDLHVARFTDDATSITVGAPCSLGAATLPPWLFAIDADHVVVIDEHAQARVVVLP